VLIFFFISNCATTFIIPLVWSNVSFSLRTCMNIQAWDSSAGRASERLKMRRSAESHAVSVPEQARYKSVVNSLLYTRWAGWGWKIIFTRLVISYWNNMWWEENREVPLLSGTLASETASGCVQICSLSKCKVRFLQSSTHDSKFSKFILLSAKNCEQEINMLPLM